MSTSYTEPKIVTSDDLNKRSYVEFYFNKERIREYHGKNVGLRINPNRAKSLSERNQLLNKLQFEIRKSLENDSYPLVTNTPDYSVDKVAIQVSVDQRTVKLLFNSVKHKLRSGLSKSYKRDLKSVYRELKVFFNTEELNGPLADLKTHRIDMFLSQFGSSGTYYMNKRRNLSVLFNSACKQSEIQLKTLKETNRRKSKARLHVAYDKEQLKPILNYLKQYYPNLYICCLITYSSWLRPHEEIRLLTYGDFKKDFTEVHLTGGDNKGGKVRVVYIPEYVRTVIIPFIGAAVGGGAGKFVEKAWDSGEKWLLSYFKDHRETAQLAATENTKDFLEKLASRVNELEISNRVSKETLEQAQDHPDFSVLLQKALLTSAQTDSKDKHQLLARLVSERLTSEPETVLALGSKMACDAISFITHNQLRLLGLIVNLYLIKPDPLPPTADFQKSDYQKFMEGWLLARVNQFLHIKIGRQDFNHLQSLSCLRVQSLSGRNLNKALSNDEYVFDYNLLKTFNLRTF